MLGGGYCYLPLTGKETEACRSWVSSQGQRAIKRQSCDVVLIWEVPEILFLPRQVSDSQAFGVNKNGGDQRQLGSQEEEWPGRGQSFP